MSEAHHYQKRTDLLCCSNCKYLDPHDCRLNNQDKCERHNIDVEPAGICPDFTLYDSHGLGDNSRRTFWVERDYSRQADPRGLVIPEQEWVAKLRKLGVQVIVDHE